PLISLDLERCSGIKDLTPLQGMKLTTLNLNSCSGVQSLIPLKGMPLTSLAINGCPVRDLFPLQGMALIEVSVVPKGITEGMSVLRRMTSLKTIIVSVEKREKYTPEEFWKRFDAGEFK